MATETPPTIPALSPAPDPTNRAEFDPLAYNFTAGMNPFGVQANALALNVKHNADEALTAADAALSHANASAALVAAPTWLSGTTYAAEFLARDPVDLRSYRRISTGAGTARPALDPTNWRPTGIDIETGYPSIRPTLLLDFANSKTVDPRITGTFGSIYLFNELGVLTLYPSTGVFPITYDPVTGKSQGLQVWRASTNNIANNTNVGAVVGSPGTAPTGWSIAYNTAGVTSSIDLLSTVSGIPAIRVRFQGTPTVTSGIGCFIVFDSVARPAAVTNSDWTASAFVRVASGTPHSSGAALFSLQQFNSGGTAIGGVFSTTFTLTSNPLNITRVQQAMVASNASVASVGNSFLGIATTSGVPLDVTLEIGLPQFEAGKKATPPIFTSGTVLTRAASAPVIGGADFSKWYRADEGTFVCDFYTSAAASASNVAFGVGTTGLFDESTYISTLANTTNIVASIVDGGVSQLPGTTLATASQDVPVTTALSYRINDVAASANGGTLLTDTSVTLPTCDRLALGCSPWALANQLDGGILSLTYYPSRITNAQNQAVSTQ